MRTLLLRFVPSQASRFCLVIGAVLAGTASACTSPPRASKPPVTVASATAAVCTAERTETLLRALFRDYNAGQDVVGTYLAGPDRFVRWWDPTLPPGGDLAASENYPKLSPHLRDLHDQGIHLTVTGYHGTPNGGSSIGFVFGVRQGLTPTATPGLMNSKGNLDCTTNRFTILVIDAW
jgi:hypothetical protein